MAFYNDGSGAMRWAPLLESLLVIGILPFAQLLRDRVQNKKFVQDLFYYGDNLSTRAKILADSDEHFLIEMGQKLCVIHKQSGRARYFVQYELDTVAGVRTVTQIAVFTDGVVQPSQLGLPDYGSLSAVVFFSFLLPKAKAILADTEQSGDGMRFWKRMIAIALGKGMFVFVYDRNTGKKYRIANSNDLDAIEGLIWGTGARHLFVRPLITNENLFPEALPAGAFGQDPS